MFFRKVKQIFSDSKKTRANNHPAKTHKVCPKIGKELGCFRKYPWLIWLFPIAGLLSLIWFLIRVLPKPSRATYPCQRVAAPLASGFVVWIAGIICSTLAYRKAKRSLRRSRYVMVVRANAGLRLKKKIFSTCIATLNVLYGNHIYIV